MKKHNIWTAAFILVIPALAVGELANFPKANFVLGQKNLEEKSKNTTARSLNQPGGVAIDPTTGKVFVADTGNNRVLRYANLDSLGTGAPAEAVIGQTGVALGEPNQGGSPGLTTLSGPAQVSVDAAGTLWVADAGNNRVLGFAFASAVATGAPAQIVFGQPNFNSVAAPNPPTANSLSQPGAAWADNGNRLWIVDTGNNRVLRLDNLSGLVAVTFNGAPANGVLGQADFVSNAVKKNRYGFRTPAGVAIDSAGRLWVSDSENNRVLRFDAAASASNGHAATRVLGQKNFTTTSPARGGGGMDAPAGIFIDHAGNLWVTDRANDRVLRFDNAGRLANGADADAVIGQPDFTSARRGVSNRMIDILRGNMVVDLDNRLWLPDDHNNRVLRFTPLPILEFKGGSHLRVAARRVRISGTASDSNGIESVRYKFGNTPFKTARGDNHWFFRVPVQPGANVIRVIAINKLGVRSDTLRINVIRQ